MSYSVAQRTGEMAVRSALGASARQVLGLVVRRGAVLGLIGIALGLIVAFASRQLIASQVYEVGTLDPTVFVRIPVALFAVVLFASYVPARRAAKVDPAGMLRTE